MRTAKFHLEILRGMSRIQPVREREKCFSKSEIVTISMTFLWNHRPSFLIFSTGTAVRYHIGRVISLSLNVDFLNANPSFDGFVDMNNNWYTITQRVNVLSAGVGVAYRLR